MKINFDIGDTVQLRHAFAFRDVERFSMKDDAYITGYTLRKRGWKESDSLNTRKTYFRVPTALLHNIDLKRPNQLLLRGKVIYFCNAISSNGEIKNQYHEFKKISDKTYKEEIEKHTGTKEEFYSIFAKIIVNNVYIYLEINTLEKYGDSE